MSKRRSYLILFLIVLLASILRFYKIRELTTFLGDQAIELLSTYQILQGKLTLIGIKTSVSEVRNGALMYYIMAPFLYLFNYHPLAGGFIQAMFSILAVITTYIIARKHYSQKIALIASFLIASSGLLIKFSRQTMLAFYPLFFSGLFLFQAGNLLKKFKLQKALVLGIILGLSLQVHYSTISLVFVSLGLILFLEKENTIQYILALLSGFLIGFSPMIIFELRHEFFNTKMLIQHFSASSSSEFSFVFFIRYLINTVSLLFFGGKLFFGTIFLFVLAVFVLINRKNTHRLTRLLYLQIASTVLFVALMVRNNVPHYGINCFIPLSILASYLLFSLAKILPSKIRKFIIFFSLVGYFFLNLSFSGYSDNHGFTMDKGWNLPGIEKASNLIMQDVKEEGLDGKFNISMIVDAQNQALPIRYFLETNRYHPLSLTDYDKADILYVVIKPELNIHQISIWEINSFGAFEIEKTWPIQNGYLLQKLKPQKLTYDKITLAF